jgi:hypothetical protein
MAAYHKFQVAKISLIAQGLREEAKLETKKN